MNHLTPEQALADVKAVRRDRADSHWFACAIVLADRIEADKKLVAQLQKEGAELRRDWQRLDRENADLRAELDVLKAPPSMDRRRRELDALADGPWEGEEKPSLARFLPRRPDDVPAPPDGWVYVGMDLETNEKGGCSKHIGLFLPDEEGWDLSEWNADGRGNHNLCIRWTAPAYIWHRFGLLAPSEGGGWIPHTPGDVMPCEGGDLIYVMAKGYEDDALEKYATASHCGWDKIIGWRPALAEVRS
jgi:hypothetical protein